MSEGWMNSGEGREKKAMREERRRAVFVGEPTERAERTLESPR